MTSHQQPRAGPPEPVDWEALARYVTGESTGDERADVGAWIAAEPSRAALVSALEHAFATTAFVPPADLDVEGRLRSVLARRDETSHVGNIPSIMRARPAARAGTLSPRRWRTAALLAASIVAVAALGVLWQRARELGSDAATPLAVAVFQTAIGARDSVRLPDGTRVVLGPGTRLALIPGYGESRRELELRGEAFFDVHHDDGRPFIVHAGGAAIRDLGTRFAVHEAADGVRVVVTGGSVLLRADRSADSLVLLRGDRGAVGPDGMLTAQRAAATEDDLAWTRGRLVFRDAPLAQVQDDVRRWYGIELRVADPTLAGRHITTTFAGDPPERVVRVIALALGASAERSGDTVTLRANAGGSRR